jgi:urea transporter
MTNTSQGPARSGLSFSGTMPAWGASADQRPVLAFLDSCLRGVGQIALMNNPLTGLLILVALFLADLQLGVMVVIGLLASTLTAYLLRLDYGRIRAGLCGYNGALVGAALATFLAPRWGGAIFIATVVVGAGSTILWVATAAVARAFEMPPLTFPFNFVTIPFLWATFASTRIGRGPGLAEHALAAPIDPLLRALETGPGGLEAGTLLNALLRGISQLFLADSVVAGILILIAILICSPIAMVMALVGSAIGGLIGLALGADGFDIYHGLWGFNSYITAIAIGGFFLVPTWRSIAYALAAAVAAALLHGGLSIIFAHWGAPSLTLPFCITTVAFLLIRDATPALQAVPLPLTTTPEAHRALQPERDGRARER